MKSWKKLKAIRNNEIADLDRPIVIGFGEAVLYKNGKQVIDGEKFYRDSEEQIYFTFFDAENIAKSDRDNDWRVVLNGPLRGCTYQRHGVDKWVLIETNIGFA